MPIVRTVYLGVAVQGNIADPAGPSGLVYRYTSGTFINPSLKLWQQSGAPFGSAQTVHFVSSGALPDGVEVVQDVPGGPIGFSTNQFGISGIPRVVGVFTGSFGASGAFGGDTFTITVETANNGTCPNIGLTPTILSDGLVGNAYTPVSFTPDAGASPYTYDIIAGSLPDGMSLSSTGTLSGTPTASGSYPFSIRVTDNNGCTGVLSTILTIGGFSNSIHVTQLVVLTMAPNIVSCPTPDEGEDLCNTIEDPVLFASWDPSGTRYWFAETSMDDDATRYGGWKDDRLLSVGEIRRALSGPNYDYEVGTFSVEFADEDYFIRSKLADAPGRYYPRREVEVYMTTPSARDDNEAARRIATGFIDSDPSYDNQSSSMSVQFTCRDRIGSAIGWTNTGQSKVPRRVLTAQNLPGCVQSALGLAAPIWYGRLSTNIQASGVLTPPIHDVDPTHCGGFADVIYPFAGYGNWNATPPAPSGVSATVLAGGELSTETPHDDHTYYIQVYAVDAQNNMGDPSPFCHADLSVVVSSGNQTIEVSWSASPGAAKYIAVLGTFYYSVGPQQYIETTSLSCRFTRSPSWPNGATQDTITPGARPSDDAQITYYHVRSRNGNAVSALSPSQSFQSVVAPRFPNNKFRPARIWWQSTGAPEYEVLSKGPGNPITATTYDWKWIVPSGQFDPIVGLHYFDNDFLYATAIPIGAEEARAVGMMQPIYTRNVVLPDTDTWREFLIAGLAIQGVDDWYYDPGGPATAVETNQGDGTEWLFPKVDGTGAWYNTFNTKYRDIIGLDGRSRRFTFGYGKGPKADAVASGTHRITLNIRGVETAATGNGTLLEDLHDQFLHLLQNVIVVSGEGYMSGPYAPTPTMGVDAICAIDTAALDALKTMRQSELPGGLLAAGGVGANGAQVSVTDELRKWQTCGEFRLGPNRFWQITSEAIQESLRTDEITTVLTDQFDVHVRSFKPVPRLAELANVIPYRYKRNYVGDGWYVDNQRYTNDTSIDAWRTRQESSFVEFDYLTDAITVAFVLGKRARRVANVPTYIDLEGSLCLTGAQFDVGRYLKLDHWRGVGPTGYAGRPLWILANTLNPASRRVALSCLDMQDLIVIISPSGTPAPPTPSGGPGFDVGGLLASDDEQYAAIILGY